MAPPKKRKVVEQQVSKRKKRWSTYPFLCADNGDKYYLGFKWCDNGRVGSKVVSVGDSVVVETSADSWFGEIICLWEDKYRSKWVECKWYYKPEQTGGDIEAEVDEVFESQHIEEVPLGQFVVAQFLLSIRHSQTGSPALSKLCMDLTKNLGMFSTKPPLVWIVGFSSLHFQGVNLSHPFL